MFTFDPPSETSDSGPPIAAVRGWLDLEPRVLLSASPVVAAGVDWSADTAEPAFAPESASSITGESEPAGLNRFNPHDPSIGGDEIALQSGPDRSPPVRSIIIIDGDGDDAGSLLREIDDGTAVHYLDQKSDGVDQITSLLSQYRDLDSVHLVSHGSAGQLHLGSGVLDTASLGSYGKSLATWGDAMARGGDLLLYGCDVAAGIDGRGFIDAFSEAAGVDFAASDDLTGGSAAGGDWELEYRRGTIQASSFVSASAAAEYDHTLDVVATEQGSATNIDGSSLQVGVNITAADQLLVVSVAVAHRDEITAVGATLDDGTALALYAETADSTDHGPRLYHYYAVDPAIGSQNVTVNFVADSGYDEGATVQALTFDGADLSDPFSGYAEVVDRDSSVAVSFQSVDGVRFSSLVLDHDDTLTTSFDSTQPAQTDRRELASDTQHFVATVQTESSSSQSTGYTYGRTEDLAFAAFNINEAPDLTGGPVNIVVDTSADYAAGDNRFGNTASVAALLADRGSDNSISLREAIEAANAEVGGNTIEFNLAAGDRTINLAGGTLAFESQIVVDGNIDGGDRVTLTTAGTQEILRIATGSDGSEVRRLQLIGGNGRGLVVTDDASQITLADNLIRDVNDDGILIIGTASDIVLTGNTITAIRGNGGHGIQVAGFATDVVIGSDIGQTLTPGRGNVISDVNVDGIQVRMNARQVTIRGNQINNFGGEAIRLGSGSGNDGLDDTDNGPNGRRNYPVIDYAAADDGTLRVLGNTGSNDSPLTIDFYASDRGPGQSGGSTRSVATFQSPTGGDGSFNQTFLTAVTPGEHLTALATDANGNTSQFAVNRTVASAPSIDAGPDQTIDHDEPLALIGNVQNAGPGGTVFWDLNNNGVADGDEPTTVNASIDAAQVQSRYDDGTSQPIELIYRDNAFGIDSIGDTFVLTINHNEPPQPDPPEPPPPGADDNPVSDNVADALIAGGSASGGSASGGSTAEPTNSSSATSDATDGNGGGSDIDSSSDPSAGEQTTTSSSADQNAGGDASGGGEGDGDGGGTVNGANVRAAVVASRNAGGGRADVQRVAAADALATNVPGGDAGSAPNVTRSANEPGVDHAGSGSIAGSSAGGNDPAASRGGETSIAGSTWIQDAGGSLTARQVAMLSAGEAMWEAMDETSEQLRSTVRGDLVVAGTVGAAASSITVGVLAWAARGGLLVSGLMAQMPAWRKIDPLLIMRHLNSPAGNESLQQMMDRRNQTIDSDSKRVDPPATTNQEQTR